uniref:Type I polyketide synthase n=1 Tax=Gambierdiscus excentricus TaxID=986170 RepID=A0A1S6K7U9_9DINO|nr:type I polyketide synthase [Gambierdiscus excentricus]
MGEAAPPPPPSRVPRRRSPKRRPRILWGAMLLGMMGSMLDSMGGADPSVVNAIKENTNLMHFMANPRVVVAMRDISEDPGKLADYREDQDVLGVLERVARVATEVGAGGIASPEPEQHQAVAGARQKEQEPDEARQKQQAEMQHRRRTVQQRRIAGRIQPLEYDIEGWMDRPWYDRSTTIARRLQQKGFCVLRGGVASSTREKAILEAAKLKRSGTFIRPPREVLPGLFGEHGSAWTRELSDPNKPAPPEDEALRALDAHIAELGGELSGCSESAFGMRIQGRTVGVVHHSRMQEDQSNPPLLDPGEADGYMALFITRKVKMVYYVGPSTASMRITPIDDEAQTYRSNLPPNTIIALRGDVCRLAVEPRPSEIGICVEVDFLAERKMGLQESLRDRVPPPDSLEDWYMNKLQAIVENDMMENVPDDWMTLARTTFYNYNTVPICVREISQDLPITNMPEDWVQSFDTCVKYGNDGITEIPLSKWEITSYYDQDPMNVDDFKMYTRHMGVLNCGHTPSDEHYLREFGIPKEEAIDIDYRHVMLCESAMSCLRVAGVSKSDTQGKNIGVFVGLTGNEMYYRFISREAKLGKSTCCNMSNAANVNRMSYLFGSTGPSVAVDTEDSSGSSAVDTSISYLREDRCDMTLAASVSLLQHPFSLIIHCATGGISRTGRSRVLDESADGVVRSDGVVTVLLQPKRKPKKGEADKASDEAEEVRHRCLILGSALNSRGVSSSLMAPNAAAISDVIRRAFKDASCPVSVIQALDLNASGNVLPDAMEVGMMQKAINTGNKPQTVALRNCKSIFGETGAPSGLASLLRACISLESAVHGPCIHLQQYSDMALSVQEDDELVGDSTACRVRPHVEVMEARYASQTVGVNSFGGSGTSVHHVLWGQKPPEERPNSPGPPISWFPTTVTVPSATVASDEETELMTADFFIIGTWNGWEKPLKMEKDATGVFSHVLALGENLWETFQILVDGDDDKILHPMGSHITVQDSEIYGPTARGECGRFMTWCINGRSEKAWLINEEQGKQLRKEMTERMMGPDQQQPLQLENAFKITFRGDYKPKGYEHVTNYTGMPVMENNRALIGAPGDLYRVRFHLTGGGRYRRVEWSKVPPGANVELPEYTHSYYIAGDHNFWCFSKMDSHGGGKYSLKVQLLDESTTFQVIRDKDWDQTFCPKIEHAAQDAEIDSCNMGGGNARKWKISGQAGDSFQVVFERSVSVDGSEDIRHISWELIANEAIDRVEMSKGHKYFVVGSWNKFEPAEMYFDEDRGAFILEMKMVLAEECFQILLNQNWLSLVYPSSREASFHDQNHEVKGPDTSGSYNCWVVGRHGDDDAKAGNLVRIFLFLEAGLPKRVAWECFDAEAHRQHVAEGCESILEEQCQRLGL